MKTENGGMNMERIWNALLYGDSGTRRRLGSVILFCIAGIAFIIVSGVSGQFYLFVAGMLCGVAALILSQSFTLVDDDFVAQVGKDGKKDTVKSVSAVKNPKKTNDSAQSVQPDEELKTAEKYLKEKKEKTTTGDESADFSKVNEKELKRIKRKYHVKKDHRPILIDNSQTYHIKECPAFIWRVHNKVNILLLEKEPRRIRISRDLISGVEYVPNVRANKQKEYLFFQKENLVTNVFEGFLPDYRSSKAKDPNLKYKNLYQIYPDIQITNRSIDQVMDLLCLDLLVKDKITESSQLNSCFKQIYIANILYKDRVYSISDYKEKVEKTLEEMCYMDLTYSEFVITLENLMKAGFISETYADYYTDVRSRVANNK